MAVDFSDVTQWERQAIPFAARWERREDRKWIEGGEWVLSWPRRQWRAKRDEERFHELDDAFAAAFALPGKVLRHRSDVLIRFRDTSDCACPFAPDARDRLGRHEQHQRVLLSQDASARSTVLDALKQERKSSRRQRRTPRGERES